MSSSSSTSTKKKQAQRHTWGRWGGQGLSLENLTSLPSSIDPIRDQLAPWQLLKGSAQQETYHTDRGHLELAQMPVLITGLDSPT